MSANKSNPPTKTIAFRLDSDLVDLINNAAKKEGIKMQEYFLNQLDPKSDLANIIRAKKEEAELKERKVAVAVLDFIVGINEIKQKSELDDESFTTVLKESVDKFVKGKKNAADKKEN